MLNRNVQAMLPCWLSSSLECSSYTVIISSMAYNLAE